MAYKMTMRPCLLRWLRMSLSPCKCHLTKSFLYDKRREYALIYPRFTSAIFFSQNVNSEHSVEKKKKNRNVAYLKIDLIETDGNLTVTSLEEAEKIAKRRDLKLFKIVDKQASSERPVYKVMTAGEYLKQELEARKLKKEEKKTGMKQAKLLSISDKIGKHDLEAKCKILKKWLEKSHEVRLAIVESEASLSAHIVKTIESATKEFGKVVQKRQNGKEIKFSILPIKKEISDSNEL